MMTEPDEGAVLSQDLPADPEEPEEQLPELTTIDNEIFSKKRDPRELAPFYAMRAQYPLLSRDEESRQIDICQRSSSEAERLRARDLVVYSNVGLVIYIAKRYQGHGVPLADLVQEGLAAISSKALEKFDPSLGYQLSTYAYWWIRAAIQRAVENARTDMPFRVSVRSQENMQFIRSARGAFQNLHGRKPDLDELTDAVNALPCKGAQGLTRELIERTIRQNVGKPRSLDASIGPDQEATLHDRLSTSVDGPGAFAASRDELIDVTSEISRMRDAFVGLNPRTRKFLTHRYGLNGDQPMTLQEVGSFVGLSRELVRQVQAKAQVYLAKKLGMTVEAVERILDAMGASSATLSPADTFPSPEQKAPDDASLEECLSLLSQHATNWRGRGKYHVLAPALTLRLRTHLPIEHCINVIDALASKGWMRKVDGDDAVVLLRLDKVSLSETEGDDEPVPVRIPFRSVVIPRPVRAKPPSVSEGSAIVFLRERSIIIGDRRIVRAAVIHLKTHFKIHESAALGLLFALVRSGDIVSDDEWLTTVILTDAVLDALVSSEPLPVEGPVVMPPALVTEPMVDPPPSLPVAGKDGILRVPGALWVLREKLPKLLKLDPDDVAFRLLRHRRMVRTKTGLTQQGKQETFYAFADAKRACANLLAIPLVRRKADELSDRGDHWVSGPRFGDLVGRPTRFTHETFRRWLGRAVCRVRTRRVRTPDGTLHTLFLAEDLRIVLIRRICR